MKTLIQNCRIVSPGIEIPKGGIVMENDRITAVGEIPEQESFDSVIDGINRPNVKLTFVNGVTNVFSQHKIGYICSGNNNALITS